MKTLDSAAVFILGYLYCGTLRHDHRNRPLCLCKRIFNDGSCEVWGGVKDSQHVGSYWTVAKVNPSDADAYLQACKDYLETQLPSGFHAVQVQIVEWA